MKKGKLLLVLMAGLLFAGCTVKKNPTSAIGSSQETSIVSSEGKDSSERVSTNSSVSSSSSDPYEALPMSDEDKAQVAKFIEAVSGYYSLSGTVTIKGEDGTFVHIIQTVFGEDYYVSKDVSTASQYSDYYKEVNGKLYYGLLQPDNTYKFEEVKEEGYSFEQMKNPYRNLTLENFTKTSQGFMVNDPSINVQLVTGWNCIDSKTLFTVDDSGNIIIKVITHEKNGDKIELNEYTFAIGKPEDVSIYYKNNGDAAKLDAAFKGLGKNFTITVTNHEDGYEDVKSTVYATENNVYDSYSGAIKTPGYYKDASGYTYEYYWVDRAYEVEYCGKTISLRFSEDGTAVATAGNGAFFATLTKYEKDELNELYYGIIETDDDKIFEGARYFMLKISGEDIFIDDKGIKTLSETTPGYEVSLFEKYDFDVITIDLSSINAEAFNYDSKYDVYYPANTNVLDYYIFNFGYNYDTKGVFTMFAQDMEVKLTEDGQIDYVKIATDIQGAKMIYTLEFSNIGTTTIPVDMDEIMKNYVEVPKSLPSKYIGTYVGEMAYDPGKKFSRGVKLEITKDKIKLNDQECKFICAIVNKDKTIDYKISCGNDIYLINDYAFDGQLSIQSIDGSTVSRGLNQVKEDLTAYYGTYKGSTIRVRTDLLGTTSVELVINEDGITLNGEKCPFLGYNSSKHLIFLYKDQEVYGQFTSSSSVFELYLDDLSWTTDKLIKQVEKEEPKEITFEDGTYKGSITDKNNRLSGATEATLVINGTNITLNGQTCTFVNKDDESYELTFGDITIYLAEGYDDEPSLMLYSYDDNGFYSYSLIKQANDGGDDDSDDTPASTSQTFTGRIYIDTNNLFGGASTLTVVIDGDKITMNDVEVNVVSKGKDEYTVTLGEKTLYIGFNSETSIGVYDKDYETFCTMDLELVGSDGTSHR